jgi:hypothetical protein
MQQPHCHCQPMVSWPSRVKDQVVVVQKFVAQERAEEGPYFVEQEISEGMVLNMIRLRKAPVPLQEVQAE